MAHKDLFEVVVPYINDSDELRPAAKVFEENGYYTAYPPGTKAFMDFWDEELRRCIYGYTTPSGLFITGYNYFYLNYSRIIITKEVEIKTRSGKIKKVPRRVESFPRVYDYDVAYFLAIEAAEEAGKHLATIKARGKGYSYKGASMLCRNFYCIPKSRSLVVASETEFLIKDGLLSKAWDMMSFIDQHTAFSKKRQKKDTTMHKRASFIVEDEEFGIKSEVGWGSEIMGITLKNDPDKARGKRAKLILWEESGKFPNLKAAWQIARPSVEDNNIAFGLMIAFGTGGSGETSYEGLKDLFYEPYAYNVLPINNIWDDGAKGNACSFFVPNYYNMEGYDKEGIIEKGKRFMDENGNSDIEFSIKYMLAKREEIIANASDKTSIDRYIAERPMKPAEATLILSGNIFPKKDLLDHLSFIITHENIKNLKQLGDLYIDTKGKVKWRIDSSYRDITRYRIPPGESKQGAIAIWEHPIDDPPWGLYIIGCLLPGEKVVTDSGLMNVEDVEYSDKLVDKDGNLVEIKKLLRYQVDNEDTYELKMSNVYRTTIFTKEHPIYVSSHNLEKNKTINEDLLKFDFKKVSDVKKGDWIKYPNIYLNEDTKYEKSTDITENFNEDYWWFQGLWLGDGWCSKNSVYVVFNVSDVKQIERFKKYVTKDLGKKLYCRTKNNTLECRFTHKSISNYLVSTYGKYANNKHIPEYIKHKQNRIKENLFLGYLDSDGCVYKDSRGYISLEFVSINLRLLEDFQDIGFSLGLVGNLSKLRNKGKYIILGKQGIQKKAYHLRFGHTDSIKFAKKLSFENRSKLGKIDILDIKKIAERRKNGCFISKDGKYIYLQIKDIVKDKYSGVVYNYETETHTFLAKYCTTHNCDPYDFDSSTTDSLGSCFVYKRFQNFESYYDLPVAEYTGRPETASEFYEKVRLLALYYNATVLYENEKKGLFDYFLRKNSTHLLADQPSIIKDIIKESKVERAKGIHMTKEIKNYMIGIINEWLREEYSPGKKNLTKIFSTALLEELIAYNDTGNFDRVISFGLVLLYKRELYNVSVKKKEKKEKVELFSGGIFRGLQPNSKLNSALTFKL